MTQNVRDHIQTIAETGIMQLVHMVAKAILKIVHINAILVIPTTVEIEIMQVAVMGVKNIGMIVLLNAKPVTLTTVETELLSVFLLTLTVDHITLIVGLNALSGLAIQDIANQEALAKRKKPKLVLIMDIRIINWHLLLIIVQRLMFPA